MREYKLQIKMGIAALALTSMSLAAQSFVTEGNGIRDAVLADIDGQDAIYISEIDGAVSSYTKDGKLRWRNPSKKPAIMYSIRAADIDGDGSDELVTASADGYISAWDDCGKLLWRYNPGRKAWFTDVAVLEDDEGVRIFAGGNDHLLYELDAEGTLLSTTPIEGGVRKIEVGNFLDSDESTLFVKTLRHDKFRWSFFGFIDPDSKKVLSSVEHTQFPELESMMFTDIKVGDVNKDGRDEILLFGSGRASHNDGPGVFVAIDGEFNTVSEFAFRPEDKQRYAQTVGASLAPARDEIVIQYGGALYVTDLKGNLLQTGGAAHRGVLFNDLIVSSDGTTLYGAGQVGGGNAVYSYDTASENWWETEHAFAGRMAEVESNLETLYQQVLAFERPDYQPPATQPWVMINGPDQNEDVRAMAGTDLLTMPQEILQENTDRSALIEIVGEIGNKRDRRMAYDLTREEIVEIARSFEEKGQPFALWAGHSNDPFFLHIETIEQILEAAPTTCYGFVYAEMHNSDDPRVHHFIDEYIPRMAKAMRKQGRAKVYFRYKNTFWATVAHMSPWDRLFTSKKYSDVIVPATEDTNSRTQEINLAGRVGLLAGGYVDNFAMRLIDDNPTSWRPYSPGGQRSVSPYLRSGVMRAAYGARYGILYDIQYLEEPGFNILYALMKSGVLPPVEPENILSLGSWHLFKDLDADLIYGNMSHHDVTRYSPKDTEGLLSTSQIHWAGTDLPDYDLSTTLGAEYRWLNFMPTLPYGMVPIAPWDSREMLEEKGIPYSASTARYGIIDGEEIEAPKFAPQLHDVAKAGQAQLPVVVSGSAWSAVRLDENHVRLILIDPGYVDPQERTATVSFQGDMPSMAKDILSGEDIAIEGASATVTVPAGSVRFIDLTY